MKKNNNKNSSARRKLAAAIAMLMISTLLLSSATYAWFTMNKEVQVTNMQVKAHAEEGLLINEVALATDSHWDELAYGGDADATSLRPASTSDLITWWHANSKVASDEAGAIGLSGTTVDPNTVDLTYEEISPAKVEKETTNASGTVGKAEKTVYYKNATYGSGGTAGNTYDDGEGFYVKYTYYLKSSKSDGNLNVSKDNLTAEVTATNVAGSGASADLDKALRVGIQVGSNTENFNIFAPISGATTEYSVAGSTSGTTYKTVKAQTAKAAINPNDAVAIPKVTSDGIPVYVYIWFEGEDDNCKSDNLKDVLDSYSIDIKFTDEDL